MFVCACVGGGMCRQRTNSQTKSWHVGIRELGAGSRAQEGGGEGKQDGKMLLLPRRIFGNHRRNAATSRFGGTSSSEEAVQTVHVAR